MQSQLQQYIPVFCITKSPQLFGHKLLEIKLCKMTEKVLVAHSAGCPAIINTSLYLLTKIFYSFITGHIVKNRNENRSEKKGRFMSFVYLLWWYVNGHKRGLY